MIANNFAALHTLPYNTSMEKSLKMCQIQKPGSILKIAVAGSNPSARGRLSWQKFFQPLTLTSDIFATPSPKPMFTTSFERSTSYLFGD